MLRATSMGWLHRVARASGFAAALLTAACGGEAALPEGGVAACFPEAARPWVPVATVPTDGPEAGGPARSGAVVYIDGSGSMAGYVSGRLAGEGPMLAVLETLPGAVGGSAGPVRYVQFGKRLRPLTAEGIDALPRSGTYACGGAAGCDNDESALNLVFADVAKSAPGQMAVILSDLWLMNSDLAVSGPASLSTPLRDIIASGRSVAIYGFVSPYVGSVVDMPRSPRPIPVNARPLYLVVVGPADRLAAFDDQLRNGPEELTRLFAQGKVRRSVFGPNPFAEIASETPFGKGFANTAFSRGAGLRVMDGLRIEQITLSRGDAAKAKSRAAAIGPEAEAALAAVWEGPVHLADDAVWQGDLETHVQTWPLEKSLDGCPDDAWGAPVPIDGTVSAVVGTHPWSRRLAFEPVGLAGALGDGVHLIVGEVVRPQLARPNPDTAWMRQWSFDATDEDQLRADPPPVFPTLHLAETARLLENAMVEAEPRNQAVAGFAVIVRVKP